MTQRTFRSVSRWGLVLALLLAFAAPSSGQTPYSGTRPTSNIVDPTAMPGTLKEVRFDQQLGKSLPLDAAFVDELGQPVTLGDYFGGDRPVLLALVYYDCPMLCTLILHGIAKALGVLQLDVGTDFDVVLVSFAAGETPEMAREAEMDTLQRYGRPETAEGWHFLSAPEELEGSIRQLTEAVGFEYAYLEESGEYAHASGIMIATPEGTLSQYFYGFDYPPKDVRLALVEASNHQIGGLVDQILLYCFRYDPALGKYTAVVTRALQLAGLAFLLGLALFLWIMFRADRREPQQASVGAAP